MILKCLGIGVLALSTVSVLRNLMPSLVPFVIGACGIVITFICLEHSEGSLGYYYDLCTSRGYDDYFAVLLKGLGITFIVNTGSELCRDCGQGQLASYLEFAAKTGILAIAFPMIKSLIELSEGIMLT